MASGCLEEGRRWWDWVGSGDGEGAETGCVGDGEGGWRTAPGSWLGGGGYKVMASPEEGTTRGGAGLCRGACVHVLNS